MGSVAGNLLARVGADTSGLTAAMSDLNSRLSSAGAAASRSLGGIESFSRGLASVGGSISLATLPLVGFAASAAKSAADMESLTQGLTAVSGSSKEAERQLGRLKEVAKLPGLGFRDAVQGAINLQAAGLSASLAERALKGFGNALATVGKGKDDLDGVNRALAQIAAKGKVSAEEINQLAERLPQIRKLMESAFGTADTEVLQKRGIGAKDFINAIVIELEKLPPVAGGVKNSFENLSDSVQQSLAEVGKGLLPAAKAAIDALTPLAIKVGQLGEKFAQLPDPARNSILAIGGIVALSGPVLYFIGQAGIGLTTLVGVTRTLTGLNIVGTLSNVSFALSNGLVPALVGAERALVPLVAGLKALPFVAVAAGVYLLLKPLADQRKGMDEAADSMRRLNERYREGLIATGQLRDKKMDLIKSVFAVGGAIEKTGQQTYDLAGAFSTLGIQSSGELKTQLEKAQGALDTVKLAFKEGKASAEDVSRATEAYRAVLHAIKPVVEQAAAVLVKSNETLNKEAVLREIASRALAAHNLELREYVDILERAQALSKAGGIILEVPPILGGGDIRDINLPSGKEIEWPLPPLDDIQNAKRGIETIERAAAAMGGTVGRSATRANTEWRRLGNQVSTIVTDMSRGIADLIFKGGKFGEMMKGIAVEAGKAFTRFFVEQGINVAINGLSRLLGLGAQLPTIFSGIGGAASSSAAGGAATAASGIGSASSAASGVGSIAGMVTAGSSVAQVITSIVGIAKAAKDMDVLHKHTLQMVMLGEATFALLDNRLTSIHDRLMQIVSVGLGVYNAPGDGGLRLAGEAGGGLTVNVSGGYFMSERALDDFIDAFASRLRQRGLKL